MAEGKRFYWIKLKTDFFNLDEIDFLLSQKNGCEYIVLYQMLCLKTANNEGVLNTKIGEMIIPFDVQKIARDTKYFDVDTVMVAMELFKKLGLIYEETDGTLKISSISEMVGSESAWAEKKRLYRENAKALPEVQSKGQSKGQKEDNVREEIEIRDKSIEYRDKNIDIDKDILSGNPTSELVKSVVEYLNEKVGTNYKHTSRKTQELIRARVNDGNFTLEDFKTVIDNQVKEWKNDNKMAKYLRPETLFGTKFEGYLNKPKTDGIVVDQHGRQFCVTEQEDILPF